MSTQTLNISEEIFIEWNHSNGLKNKLTVPDFWSFVSNIYLYCKGQLDCVTTTANLLRQDADSSSTEGDEIWVGGKCFMLHAVHGLSRTSMINKKGIYSTKSVDLLFRRGGVLPVACCQLDARN